MGMEKEVNVILTQMLYLLACALHDTVPDKKELEGLDLFSLYRLASAHALAAMICMALESTGLLETADPEIRKRWKEAKGQAIRKNILLDAERAQILQEMDHAGIWYMPLKGSILKDFYPKFGMRQMSDNDILYDAAFQIQLKKIMIKRGYKAESVGKGSHDTYLKPPVYNYEMHRTLFNTSHDPVWAAYYSDIKKKLVADSSGAHAFRFTEEDFYIYMTIHACKHYKSSGNGLRMLVDSYVLNRAKGNVWNREYLQTELEALGIAAFEEQSRTLAEKLFGTARPVPLTELTPPELEMLLYCTGNGTYGTLQNGLRNKIKKLQPDGKPLSGRTKRRYYCSRLFPGRAWCRLYAPFVYRHPVLLPFFWIYRIVRGVLFKNKLIKLEIESVKNTDK